MEKEQSSRMSKLTPTFFKDTEGKKAEVVRHKKKQQKLRRQLGREPGDSRGKDSEGCFDFFQYEQGREDVPGVSHRTSLHILTVTDDEIKEDTLKSRAFIDRYYQAFDEHDELYSIWTLLETLKDEGRYRSQDITIVYLETMNRNFDKHAKQILGQLSLDAAERHAREARRRKNIGLIGMSLSAFTALSGSVTGFMNDGSKQSTERLAELGYSQIVIGIVLAFILKLISTQVEEHTKAARNLDVTLTWVEGEIKRLKAELISLQQTHLDRIARNQPSEIKPLLPVESQLLEMKYLWIKPNRLSSEKSLFESVARLQGALFGTEETPESVEAALSAFRAREKQEHGLFKSYTDLGGLAKIYGCTIVLISEGLLSSHTYYQLINEPVEQMIYVAGEGKEDEDEEQIKPDRPVRYMVLYMPRDNQYQPVLAPFNTTWNELKAGLAGLTSSVTPSESDDTLPSLVSGVFSSLK